MPTHANEKMLMRLHICVRMGQFHTVRAHRNFDNFTLLTHANVKMLMRAHICVQMGQFHTVRAHRNFDNFTRRVNVRNFDNFTRRVKHQNSGEIRALTDH